MTPLQEEILKVIKSFEGLTEKKNNSGFRSHKGIKDLTGLSPENLFLAIGWEKGFAWCAFQVELIWKLAYTKLNSSYLAELDKLFSGSVKIMMSNFIRSDNYIFSDKPEIGSIACWRFYDKENITDRGHCGVVTRIFGDEIETFDGNTNTEGGRDGVESGYKRRKLDFTIAPKTLVLKGFVHLKDV